MTTIAELIERALAAQATLAEVGEGVEDEWTYVTDLTSAWRLRLQVVAEARGAEASTAGPAVDRAIAEIALIEDPHRAIDWLSTFPQAVLVALGERP
jgi:hypothetical protein